MGECYEVEWAIASDWLMFQSHGSIGAVEDHNIGVANDVQTNYDDEFADELQFVITEQFVVNCSTCDPWTSSTDAGTLLNSFRGWGPTGSSLLMILDRYGRTEISMGEQLVLLMSVLFVREVDITVYRTGQTMQTLKG